MRSADGRQGFTLVELPFGRPFGRPFGSKPFGRELRAERLRAERLRVVSKGEEGPPVPLHRDGERLQSRRVGIGDLDPSRGFTLVELLVVCAIIGLLVAIAVPLLERTRDTVDRHKCAANLQGWFVGAAGYANTYNGSYPGLIDVRLHDMWASVSGLNSPILQLSWVPPFHTAMMRFISKPQMYCPTFEGGIDSPLTWTAPIPSYPINDQWYQVGYWVFMGRVNTAGKRCTPQKTSGGPDVPGDPNRVYFSSKYDGNCQYGSDKHVTLMQSGDAGTVLVMDRGWAPNASGEDGDRGYYTLKDFGKISNHPLRSAGGGVDIDALRPTFATGFNTLRGDGSVRWVVSRTSDPKYHQDGSEVFRVPLNQ